MREAQRLSRGMHRLMEKAQLSGVRFQPRETQLLPSGSPSLIKDTHPLSLMAETAPALEEPQFS